MGDKSLEWKLTSFDGAFVGAVCVAGRKDVFESYDSETSREPLKKREMKEDKKKGEE